MDAPTWALIDGRQRDWIHAAIAYYTARVAIYRLMVREWEDELTQIANSETDTETGAFPERS